MGHNTLMHCSGWMEEARVEAASSAARNTLTTDTQCDAKGSVLYNCFILAVQELLYDKQDSDGLNLVVIKHVFS